MRRYRLLAVLGAILTTLAAVDARQAEKGGMLSAADDYEIRQLYARFCHGLDSAADRGYLFADVFTSEGVYVDPSGRSHQGREKLAALAREDPTGRKGPTNVVHYTVNVVINATSGGARGKAYMAVVAPASGAPASTPGLAAAGLYEDEFVRTLEGWRLRKRTFVRASP
jgi:hypothetical protein